MRIVRFLPSSGKSVAQRIRRQSEICLVVTQHFIRTRELAAIYTEAAGEQGKYWEMQAKLFEKQGEWGEKHGHGAPATPVAPPDSIFQKYAQELGMNVEQLKVSVNDPKHAAKVDRDMRDVDTLKVMRTPTFYVNGRLLARLNQQDLRTLMREEARPLRPGRSRRKFSAPRT